MSMNVAELVQVSRNNAIAKFKELVYNEVAESLGIDITRGNYYRPYLSSESKKEWSKLLDVSDIREEIKEDILKNAQKQIKSPSFLKDMSKEIINTLYHKIKNELIEELEPSLIEALKQRARENKQYIEIMANKGKW